MTRPRTEPLVERLGIARWIAASVTDRRSALDEATVSLGGAFEVVDLATPPGLGIARLRHVATGVPFHLVPGGAFRSGLAPAEKRTLRKAAPPEERPLLDEILGTLAPPPDTLDVAPFLLASRPLSAAELRALGWSGVVELDCVPASGAREWIARLQAAGLRLPTDAEWERAARAGATHLFPTGDAIPAGPRVPPNDLGLERIGELPELTTDGGALVVRGGALLTAPWQGVAEWALMLSAARRPLGDEPVAIRAAADLFAAAEGYGAAAVRARKRAAPRRGGRSPSAPPRGSPSPSASPRTRVLDALDLGSVDWASVKVVPGSGRAIRIPEALATLGDASAPPEARQMAIGMLHARLASDATIREASALVAPYLLRLAGRVELPDRHRLLSLLALLAVGDPMSRCALGVSLTETPWTKPPGLTVLRVIAEGRDMLVDALADARSAVRRSAAHVLGFAPLLAPGSIGALLRAAGSDGDPTVRLAALHAVALLGAPPEAGPLFERALDGAEGEARNAAVSALLVVRGTRASDAELDLALRISRVRSDGSLGEAAYPFVPMPGGWLKMTEAVLARAGERGIVRWNAILAEVRAASDHALGRLPPA